MSDSHLRYLTKVAVIFVAYFVTARIGLSLDAVSGFATLVWAPTGIALAALLILGYRYWPGITLAAILVNWATGAPFLVAVGIGIGNTLEPLFGAYLLNRFAVRRALDRLRDVLSLVILAAVVSTAVSATVGVSSLLIGSVIDASAYGQTWVAWWSGDMLGMLVVAPLLLVWSERLRGPLRWDRVMKAVVPTVLLLVISVLVFQGFVRVGVRPFVLAYIIFPIMIGIALRFGQLGSVTATFLVALTAIWGTVVTFDASRGTTLSQTLLLLQVFIGVTAVTFMTLSAMVTEREQTLKHQQQLIHKAAVLSRQRERLKVLNEAKDEFISIASHQLRTPATSVKQYLGMLLDTYAGRLSEQQHTYIKAAYDSNERQLKIINNLLQVARLDSGTVHIKKTSCSLTQLMRETVRQHEEQLVRRNMTLHFRPGKIAVRARVDRELISMVLENIIDNAIKYSPKGGKITITVAKAGKHVVMQISDQGIGIAKPDQKKLFRKFSRLANAQTGNISGTGLGLYWAKKVIRLHGGTISLASELDKGSTFTISLPA